MKAVLLVLVCALAVGYLGLVQRADASCHERQRLFDGQVTYTQKFLGPELHATPAQIAQGVSDLKRVLGPRPAC